jgi:hypothetical protein
MRNYDVYFELFGKKMKTRVIAENETDAQQKIFLSIIFHKLEKPKEEFNECMDMLDDVINTFTKK